MENILPITWNLFLEHLIEANFNAFRRKGYLLCNAI
jgi:hypothetical protein